MQNTKRNTGVRSGIPFFFCFLSLQAVAVLAFFFGAGSSGKSIGVSMGLPFSVANLKIIFLESLYPTSDLSFGILEGQQPAKRCTVRPYQESSSVAVEVVVEMFDGLHHCQ